MVSLRTYLLILALAAPALAASPDVEKYLRSAATLHESLEFKKALAQVNRAKKVAKGPDDEAKIALYEGVILADMGRTEKSNEAFKEALSLQPEAKLPLEVSPKVAAAFEKVRAQVKVTMAPLIAEEEARRQEDERRRQEEEERARQQAEKKRQEEESRREAERAAAAAAQPKPPEPAARVDAVSPPKSGGGGKGLALAMGGVGLVAGAGGGYFYLEARRRYDALVTRTAAPADASRLRDEGSAMQTGAFAAMGVGVALLGVSAAMLLTGGDDAAPVAFIGPDGAAVGVAVRLP